MNRPHSQEFERERRLDEVVTAYLKAVEAGELPNREEWLARHPGFASELAAFFDAQEQVDQLAGSLRAPNPLNEKELEHAGTKKAWERTSLGHYQVLGLVGQGGMGAVYKARHTHLNKDVAIKVLPTERMNNPEAVARFRREMKAVGGIDHPHLVRAMDAGEADGVHYLTMEFLEGVDLARLLKASGALPITAACEMVRQACLGLQAAYEHSLVHRDLKPANLMLARQEFGPPIVKVLDLGMALLGSEVALESEQGLTATGQIMGTLDYMAPEQASNTHQVDIRADIYSLGATLYALLTGKPVFHGPSYQTNMQKLHALAIEPIPSIRVLRPEVTSPLAAIVDKMLAKNPDKRYSTPAESAAALAPFAGGADLVALLDQAGGSGETDSYVAARTTSQPGPDRLRAFPTSEGNREVRSWATSELVVMARLRRLALVAAAAVLVLSTALWFHLRERPSAGPGTSQPIKYSGRVDVLVERTSAGVTRLLRLNEPGALPLRKDDKFLIEAEVDPPAYLYILWLDPGHDITPVYPWNPEDGWGSRPTQEKPTERIRLPDNVGQRYTAKKAKPGVATMLLMARSTPWDIADLELKTRLESLPDLPLPPGGDQAAVWFDNFVEVREPARVRTFGVVGSDDSFARWQGELQKMLGDQAAFQTAVSFARTGGK